MAATPADEIAAEIWAIRREVQNLPPLSRTRPHELPERKIEIERRLDALHTRVRNTFGGTPARIEVGAMRGLSGRRVVVERRRARAAP